MQAELFGGNAGLDLCLARFRIRCAQVVDPVQDKVIGNGENDGPNKDAHDAPFEQPSQNADERDRHRKIAALADEQWPHCLFDQRDDDRAPGKYKDGPARFVVCPKPERDGKPDERRTESDAMVTIPTTT